MSLETVTLPVRDLRINDRLHLPDGTCGTVAATVEGLPIVAGVIVAVPVMTATRPARRVRMPLDATVTVDRWADEPCRGDHDWEDVACGDRVTGRECCGCGRLAGSTSAAVSPYGSTPAHVHRTPRSAVREPNEKV